MAKPDWKKSNNPNAGDGCDNVRKYLGQKQGAEANDPMRLYEWLAQLNDRVKKLEGFHNIVSTARYPDPPPDPPNLGP